MNNMQVPFCLITSLDKISKVSLCKMEQQHFIIPEHVFRKDSILKSSYFILAEVSNLSSS